jgi:hypothetical protein
MELAALTDKERQTARDCARALAEVDQLKQRLQKAAEAAEAERLRTARLLSDTMDRLQRELHTATHDDVGKGMTRPHGNGNGNGHGEKQAGYATSRTGNGH